MFYGLGKGGVLGVGNCRADVYKRQVLPLAAQARAEYAQLFAIFCHRPSGHLETFFGQQTGECLVGIRVGLVFLVNDVADGVCLLYTSRCV